MLVNPSRLTGYSVEELSRMNVCGFLPKDSLALAKQVRHRLLAGCLYLRAFLSCTDSLKIIPASQEDYLQVILKSSTGVMDCQGKRAMFIVLQPELIERLL